MTRADAAAVLADLDPIYTAELRAFHGSNWDPKRHLDYLMNVPGGKWTVWQGDEPVICGGMMQLSRPGTGQTFLLMVRKNRIGRGARLEAVKAMRKVITSGLNEKTGLHRIECWTAFGGRPDVAKFLETIGLVREHVFPCWGANREPVWLYSTIAGG